MTTKSSTSFSYKGNACHFGVAVPARQGILAVLFNQHRRYAKGQCHMSPMFMAKRIINASDIQDIVAVSFFIRVISNIMIASRLVITVLYTIIRHLLSAFQVSLRQVSRSLCNCQHHPMQTVLMPEILFGNRHLS